MTDKQTLKVLIIGGDFLYHRLFGKAMGFEIIDPKSFGNCLRKDVDLVLFTGGEDVHPKYYGGTHTNVSFVNERRDEMEYLIFRHYLEQNTKMTGICRGFQFLNVMCGGTMYQHITNHAGYHHRVFFPAAKISHIVTSTHHQLVMLPEKGAYPIAWASFPISDIYIGPDAVKTAPPKFEIESAVYPQFNCFGVQFHPEMIDPDHEGVLYYRSIILDFINMDIDKFVSTYGYKGEENVCQI